MTVFCKDCKHSRGEGRKMTCESPNNAVPYDDKATYLVTGVEQPTITAMRGASCRTLRFNANPEIEAIICGVRGAWFEAKES